MKEKVFPWGFALCAWPSHVQRYFFDKGREGNKAVALSSAPHFRKVEIYNHHLTASVPDTSYWTASRLDLRLA